MFGKARFEQNEKNSIHQGQQSYVITGDRNTICLNLSDINPLLDDFCTFVGQYQQRLEDCSNDAERDGVELVDSCQH